ncbi:MAG: branched-chain amino acid ABC transporter permease [Firmicutes bacterium]|nr:branched-chain amino acid ABC transporter permease [Bacillota bacterium]
MRNNLAAVGIWVAVLFLVLTTLPLILSGYWLKILTNIIMFAVLAQSCNIISGYTGYPALGNVVFFGLGAYSTAILMNRIGAPFPLALLAAGLISGLYAAVLGLPILKTKGHYFVMATLGVNEATRELVNNLDFLTGGGIGMSLPIPDRSIQSFYILIYFTMLVILVSCTLLVHFVSRSPFGFALRAIRANEQAAGVMGINTTLCKTGAWVASAFFTGLAGGVYAYWLTYIESQVVFSIIIGVKFFVILLLGGAGTVFGPLLGAFMFQIIDQFIWGAFPEFHLGVLGLLMIMVVIFVPNGLLRLFETRIWFPAKGLFQALGVMGTRAGRSEKG